MSGPKQLRPLQQTPEALVQRLMVKIRAQFCAGIDDDTWYKTHYHFIKRNVVMWPARNICSVHGFTMAPEKYERVMFAILDDIERNRQITEVRYWPAYLMQCVQRHWQHHWEDYYVEAKSMRNLADTALMAFGRLEKDDGQVVESIALAHRVLAAKKNQKKKGQSGSQMSLFGEGND